jgi:hypothetical protein
MKRFHFKDGRLQGARNDGKFVLYSHHAAAIAAKDAELAKLKRRTEVYETGLRDVLDLIGQSHGVDGLHKNGDIATWSELRAGGKFESWLSAFDAAVEEIGNG